MGNFCFYNGPKFLKLFVRVIYHILIYIQKNIVDLKTGFLIIFFRRFIEIKRAMHICNGDHISQWRKQENSDAISVRGCWNLINSVYTATTYRFSPHFFIFLLRLCCGQDDFVFYLSFNIKLFNGYFHVRLGGC